MITIASTRSVFVDVDDTLVLWDWQSITPFGAGCIDIVDPASSVSCRVYVHQRHIEMLRQFKARGHMIVVWSQGGHEWAETVCKALGIDSIVDYVMDKPSWYIDDLHASAWMKGPIYLDPQDPSKDSRWGIPDDK